MRNLQKSDEYIGHALVVDRGTTVKHVCHSNATSGSMMKKLDAVEKRKDRGCEEDAKGSHRVYMVIIYRRLYLSIHVIYNTGLIEYVDVCYFMRMKQKSKIKLEIKKERLCMQPVRQ